MKKIELLAPAGNMECLKSAIEAGCDAVYFGGNCFGARAYSKNFNNDEIIEAIKYAHLYGVKVYITVNTLVYDDEVDELIKYVDFLHQSNVDAIIMQDLGMIDLIHQTFPNLEIHASTQMHIHNLDGVQLMEKLGLKRVVLARETSIDDIINIKNNSNIDLEIFIHGALCISYSGQCLMSSLIGGRSGNRGTCAGSCRLKYEVVDEHNEKLNDGDYPLSTKDLNSLEHIGDLIKANVTSLKIEGRMKSKEYVYMVVSLYREAIDNYYKNNQVHFTEENLLKLKKIFNRDYTKGFLFNAENNDIINGYRPNHIGVTIGKIIDYNNGFAHIKLNDTLTIGSGLRVLGNPDVGINVNDFYIDGIITKTAHKGDVIKIKVNDTVKINSEVVITLDKEIVDEINKSLKDSNRKILIDGEFNANINEPISLTFTDGINQVTVYGNVPLIAKTTPTTKDSINEKLIKLGDSIYKYNSLNINIDGDLFIPIKEVNELRRKAIDELNCKRLYTIPYKKETYKIDVPDFKEEKLLTTLIDGKNIDKKTYDIIYNYQDTPDTTLKIPRVIKEYPNDLANVLVGDIGAFNKGTNLDTDFSFNVTNSYTVAFLHHLGANKITLSYELDDKQIINLINSYKKRYHKHPNLELIVSGYEEVMISKFSLNKLYKKNNLFLKDNYGNLYPIKERNNAMYIYNYKKRNIYSDKYYNMGINSLRINNDI